MMDQSIFKAYDIRGIYPDQLDEAFAYSLGVCFAAILKDERPGITPKAVVGRDMRASSEPLAREVIRGLLENGVNVDDIGLVSTPTFYFSEAREGYDGGIQVSASHNPAQWNGFKLVRKRATPVSRDSGIARLQELMELGTRASGLQGALRAVEGLTARTVSEEKSLAGCDVAGIRPFKIAIDTANGMGAPDMKALFADLPCEIVWLNSELDGTFPAHPADPLVEENNVTLEQAIVEQKCDLGIASDGDGDRYFFFDEMGMRAPPEIVRGIMSQIELQRAPGSTIVYDVRPGRITGDMIQEAGGRGVLAPVGHSLIKEKMLQEGAVFGAESSGHYFYKFPCGTFEAPIVLVYKFLEYCSRQARPLSEIVAPYRKYFNSGEINTRLSDRNAGLSKLEKIKLAYADGTISEVDGLSVEYPDFWFSVRLSNTEPLIRLVIEARTKVTMEQKRDSLLALIRS